MITFVVVMWLYLWGVVAIAALVSYSGVNVPPAVAVIGATTWPIVVPVVAARFALRELFSSP